jgi:hypothetical protein
MKLNPIDAPSAKKLDPHPYSTIMPQATEEEFKNLTQDIGKNGVLHPIVVYQKKILDGNHRATAGHSCPWQKVGPSSPVAMAHKAGTIFQNGTQLPKEDGERRVVKCGDCGVEVDRKSSLSFGYKDTNKVPSTHSTVSTVSTIKILRIRRGIEGE